MVAAVARVETECSREAYRTDQAIRASMAARSIAEMLAHPFPDGDKIRAEIVIVDISLVGLSNGPDPVRERVHSAQVLLMQFQIELARRKRLINLLPTR